MNEELKFALEELVRIGASYEMAMHGESEKLKIEETVLMAEIIVLFERWQAVAAELAKQLRSNAGFCETHFPVPGAWKAYAAYEQLKEEHYEIVAGIIE